MFFISRFCSLIITAKGFRPVAVSESAPQCLVFCRVYYFSYSPWTSCFCSLTSTTPDRSLSEGFLNSKNHLWFSDVSEKEKKARCSFLLGASRQPSLHRLLLQEMLHQKLQWGWRMTGRVCAACRVCLLPNTWWSRSASRSRSMREPEFWQSSAVIAAEERTCNATLMARGLKLRPQRPPPNTNSALAAGTHSALPDWSY